jgi:LPXTG-motif cell wall-anchored protein
MRTLALAVALLLAVPAAAAAKSGVELSNPPDGLHAGEEWIVDIASPTRHVTLEIQKESTGETRSARPRQLDDGALRARIVFRSAGRWRYRVRGPHHEQEWPPVTILPARRSGGERPAREATGGFPFAWVAAAGAALALGSAALVARRRRRR